MILCLDVGNTQLFGGLFRDNQVVLRFRKVMNRGVSSDEIGVFLRSVIRENGFAPEDVRRVAYCSVVPDLNHSLANSCRHYFGVEPYALKPGVKTGLKIRYKNPAELGADRIANAIGAYTLFPGENIIVADFGTATTVEVISKDREYLGGAIVPGMKIAMQVLEERTAKLPKVEIVKPELSCGRTTTESIQAGLYFGTIGMIREISRSIIKENFPGENVRMVGTGGFSGMFRDSGIFAEIVPDLVLTGIHVAQGLEK